MLDWREARWFRGIALVVAIMLAGGFARIVLGFALDAAEANRGAAVLTGALLFGFGVRFALRRLRNEPKPRERTLSRPQESRDDRPPAV